MWKLALTLASRLVLSSAISVVERTDNWRTALRKFEVLKATEPTKEEEEARKAASAVVITCENCGERTSIQGNVTRLGELPDSPKEVLLEDAAFEWLEAFEKAYTPWPPNQAFHDLHEAIRGAEEVKPGKGRE